MRGRLFGATCSMPVARINAVLASDVGIDRLESFGAKFSRMQDTVIDKFVPILLRVLGESVGAAIDNPGRLERLHLIASADEWLQMRGLRNRLVHEYIDQPEALAPALEVACGFCDHMHNDYHGMREAALRQRA